MPRRKGESLDDYISRIAASTLARIRLSPDYYDPEGNIIVRPVIIFGKDTSDDIRPVRMDTSGRIDVTGVCPTHQADAVLSQTNPTSGDKYTVLDTTEYVRLIGIAAQVTWTVQPSPLEVHATVDGQALRWFRNNPNTATNYFAHLDVRTAANAGALGPSDVLWQYNSFILEGRSVKIEVETTGGTVSNMTCRVQYAVW
jgi:hypothetical protein